MTPGVAEAPREREIEFEGATIRLLGFRIPLKVPFRGVAHRSGVLVSGPYGWGEYSPFPGYSEDGGPPWRAAVASATRPWPPALRDRVPVHATIPDVSAEQAAAMAASSGCSAAKVKVGDDSDEARLEAVRSVLGPRGRLIADANGLWSFDQAVKKIRLLSRYGLDLVEQPVRSIQDMGRLRRAVEVPLAADESIRSAADARAFAEREAADVLVLKVQSMGGVEEALRAAEASGLPAVVSSLVETSVGISAGVALAAALPDLPYPCGLGTAGLLESDLVSRPLFPNEGWIERRRPDPDGHLLRRYEWDIPLEIFEIASYARGRQL